MASTDGRPGIFALPATPMATSNTHLADRSGGLVESHKGYDPRLISFYFIVFALLATLVGGLAYQQLSLVGHYHERERKQNQRRVLVPGPRGNIYDRNGTTLVTNKSRWVVVLHLDELQGEFIREARIIRKNYSDAGDKDLPTRDQFNQLARVTVAQRYLDQVNAILGQDFKVDRHALQNHFRRELLLPFTLVERLEDADYARLIERLPVKSPLDVYAVAVRHYPYGSAAAHTLGFVRANDEVEAGDFPGDDLKGPRQKGTIGKDGLEMQFDDVLQGEAGYSIIRVDPAGYKINPPLQQKKPKQGKNLVTSLDIDLQIEAETAIGDQTGALVAMDVATGEVLVLASKPDYDLNKFSPRASAEIVAEMNEKGSWTNLAVNGFYPPGSTFKILTTIAGMKRDVLKPGQPIVFCDGFIRVGNKLFPCYNGLGHHHDVLLPEAIAQSCDIYFYRAGELATPDGIAAEARRFHLDRKTGIDLPGEGNRMIVPDPAWKERVEREKWYPGDTANTAIGQGYVLLSPLQMACFTASVARGDTFTIPTLVHQPNRRAQQNEPIGLAPEQRHALLEGMVGCTLPPKGTARTITELAAYRIPGVRIAGKTGTAQKKVMKDGKLGNINYAWFICFAPAENPEIAMAVVLEGENLGEEFGGGRQSAPVAAAVMKKYFEKKNASPRPLLLPRKAL